MRLRGVGVKGDQKPIWKKKRGEWRICVESTYS